MLTILLSILREIWWERRISIDVWCFDSLCAFVHALAHGQASVISSQDCEVRLKLAALEEACTAMEVEGWRIDLHMLQRDSLPHYLGHL